jgi:HlyD family secretion protein
MAMDVPRGKEVARRRLIKRLAIIAVAAIAIGGTTVALARLKPAAPSVEMSGLWPGTVKRGPMERQVRGLGALKPEQIYWINAAVESRVVQIVRRAGTDHIRANDVIMVLSNPDLELEAEKAEWQMKQDDANLANLKVKLESDKLDQRASRWTSSPSAPVLTVPSRRSMSKSASAFPPAPFSPRWLIPSV